MFLMRGLSQDQIRGQRSNLTKIRGKQSPLLTDYMFTVVNIAGSHTGSIRAAT